MRRCNVLKDGCFNTCDRRYPCGVRQSLFE
jgi:hypothetical protein